MQVLNWIEIGNNPPDWDSKNPFYLVYNKHNGAYNLAWFSRSAKKWTPENFVEVYLDPPPTHYAILTPP